MGAAANDNIFPGRETHSPRPRAGPGPAGPSAPKPYNPNDDDPVEHIHNGSIRSGGSDQGQGQYIVSPSIQVRPEFSTLTRSNDATQPLTCIVVVELPGKRSNGPIPGAVASGDAALRKAGGDAEEAIEIINARCVCTHACEGGGWRTARG